MKKFIVSDFSPKRTIYLIWCSMQFLSKMNVPSLWCKQPYNKITPGWNFTWYNIYYVTLKCWCHICPASKKKSHPAWLFTFLALAWIALIRWINIWKIGRLTVTWSKLVRSLAQLFGTYGLKLTIPGLVFQLRERDWMKTFILKSLDVIFLREVRKMLPTNSEAMACSIYLINTGLILLLQCKTIYLINRVSC